MKHLVIAFGLANMLAAQTDHKPATFEAADVHVSAPGQPASGGFQPNGRLAIRGATMLRLISLAYKTDTSMIVGGPAWLNTDKFDVTAGAPADTARPLLAEMLRNLLSERFKLKVRPDKKDMPLFALTVSKQGKLRPAAAPGPPHMSSGSAGSGIFRYVFTSYTMKALAQILPDLAPAYLGRQAVDRTGLDGAFDFQLDWMDKGVYTLAKVNPDGPPPVSLFDALDKVGLRMELQNLSTDVIVVEQVEQTPSLIAAGPVRKPPAFHGEFEVAEVRPAKPGVQPQQRIQNGRVTYMGMTLKALIATAYNVNSDRIVSDMKWMDEDRFDVIAEAAHNAPFEAIQTMLKNLLDQRFGLATHTEDRPVPVLALTAGKNPKLKASNGSERSDCKAEPSDQQLLVCENTTMAQFAERLPNHANAYIRGQILDFTGLSAAFDFKLHWATKAAIDAASRASAPGAASVPVGVTVFEAVEQQLGLKLAVEKHPVPVLVVDRAQRTPR